MASGKRRLVCGMFLVMALCALTAENRQYIVAAEIFDSGASEEEKSAARLLPSLIMEQLPAPMRRDIRSEDTAGDKLWQLRQARLSLFMKLDSNIQQRDAVVLLPASRGERKRRLKAAERNIRDALLALKFNEEDTKDILDKRANGTDENTQDPVPVSIYKDDSTAMFNSGVTQVYDAKNKYLSTRYAAAAVDSKVDLLITGSVNIRSGYAAVHVTLYSYPSAEQIGAVADVGSVSKLNDLSRRLAASITSFITNTLPATVIFSVLPPEAAEVLSISVDDNVQYSAHVGQQSEAAANDNTMTIPSGLHTISFTADGYSAASATYSFIGGKQYTVEVTMQPSVTQELYIRFDGLTEGKNSIPYGNVLANAIMQDSIKSGEESPVSSIKIDGRAILGVVLPPKGSAISPVQFYVPLQLAREGAALNVKSKAYDRAALIDKRRRWFYTAYSVLITSLIGTFYTAGGYNARNGYEDIDTTNRWKMANNISIGVSVASGAWTVYELVRYLHAASQTLPNTAHKSYYEPSPMRSTSEGVLDKSNDESIQILQSEDISGDNSPFSE